jgi:DNA invertase Pin-like site-specific DNA recombinase
MFQMMGVFAEFERAIITERVLAGMARAKERGTRSGRPVGRPAIDPRTRAAVKAAHARSGVSLRTLAKTFRIGVETARRIIAEAN